MLLILLDVIELRSIFYVRFTHDAFVGSGLDSLSRASLDELLRYASPIEERSRDTRAAARRAQPRGASSSVDSVEDFLS